MPLLWLSLAFISGILLADVLHLAWSLWLGLGIASLAAWLILRRLTPVRLTSPALNRFAHAAGGLSLPAAALVVAVFAGGLRYQLAHPALTPQDIAWYNGRGALLITGVIDAPPETSGGSTTLRVKVQQIAPAPSPTPSPSTAASQKTTPVGKATATPKANSSSTIPASPVSTAQTVRGTLLATFITSQTWHYGDQVEMNGSLTLPAAASSFSYRDYLARQGISAALSYPTVKLIQSGQGNPLVAGMYAFKARGLAALAATFPTPEAEMLQGIILGDAKNIPPDLAQAYITTGTAHIIAISGFNIAILAALFTALFTRLLGRRWGALAAFIAILLYTLLVGAGPSVVRAAIMGSLGLLAVQVGRRQAGPNSLIFAAGLMCLFNPDLPWDVSFQLSFAATLGMVLYAQPLQDGFIRLAQRFIPNEWALRLGGPVGEYFLFTLAAQVTTLPVMIYHFQRLSMISLVANPLVLPAQPAVEIFGGLATLGGILYLPLGQVLAYIAWPFMAYTDRVVTWLSVVPQVNIDLGQLSLLFVILFYILLFSITLIKNWRPVLRRVFSPPIAITTAGLLAILAWQTAFALPDGRLHLTLLSSVPPASLFIQTPSGRAMLVNGGSDSPQLNEFLSQRLPYFDRRLDYLAVASTNKNALQALPPVLDAIPCTAVLWSGATASNPATRLLNTSLNNSAVPVTTMAPGDSLDLGDGAQLNVLETDASGTLLILQWRSFHALLPFPAANTPLTTITTTPPTPVNVLLLAGHGEATLNPPAWLTSLQPQLVIASLDPGGPQPQIEAQVQAALNGYPLLTNEDHGWIEVSTDGDKMWVTTEK